MVATIRNSRSSLFLNSNAVISDLFTWSNCRIVSTKKISRMDWRKSASLICDTSGWEPVCHGVTTCRISCPWVCTVVNPLGTRRNVPNTESCRANTGG